MWKRRMAAWGVLTAVAALLLLPTLAWGQGGPGGGPPPSAAPGGQGIVGKISAVSSSAITVASRDGGSKTYTLGSSAAITIDGQTAAAGALAAGQFVVVSSTDGTTATAVDAHTSMGAPPDGTPPGAGPP